MTKLERRLHAAGLTVAALDGMPLADVVALAVRLPDPDAGDVAAELEREAASLVTVEHGLLVRRAALALEAADEAIESARSICALTLAAEIGARPSNPSSIEANP